MRPTVGTLVRSLRINLATAFLARSLLSLPPRSSPRRLCIVSGLMTSGAIKSAPATIPAMARPAGVLNNSSTNAEASIAI
jgi:hypothetical protein